MRSFLNFVMLDFTAIIYICPSVSLHIWLVRKLCVSKLFVDTAHLHRHSLSFSLLKFNTHYSFSQPLFTSMIACKQVHKRLQYKQYFSILFSTEWRQSIRVRQTFRRGQVPDPSETVRGRPASAHPTVQPIRSGCYCWKVNQVLLKYRLYFYHLYIIILIMKRLFVKNNKNLVINANPDEPLLLITVLLIVPPRPHFDLGTTCGIRVEIKHSWSRPFQMRKPFKAWIIY